MDKIRAAIAEKVLEISSSDGSEIKEKLQKINRFRDLTEACQSFIKSYPEIESELLQMIQDNDFDARIASSRIDTIIRFDKKNTTKETTTQAKEGIDYIENIAEKLSNENTTYISTNIESKKPYNELDISECSTGQSNFVEDKNRVIDAGKEECPETETKYLPESEVDLEKESQYIDFEEINDDECASIKKNKDIDFEIKPNDSSTKKISNTKKIFYTLLIIFILVLAYYTIIFIIANWKIILWILIGFTLIAALFYYIAKRKK